MSYNNEDNVIPIIIFWFLVISGVILIFTGGKLVEIAVLFGLVGLIYQNLID